MRRHTHVSPLIQQSILKSIRGPSVSIGYLDIYRIRYYVLKSI